MDRINPLHPPRDSVEPGQESVWDYPRPPRLERTDRHLIVKVTGLVIAETRSGWRVLETGHPPTYYFPPGDVDWSCLKAAEGSSWCEWKGRARYFDVQVGGERRQRVAWCYPEPVGAYSSIADHLAFMPAQTDECRVSGERVVPQAGDFYGGWITSHVAGPFKGEPGSNGW